MAKTLVWQNVTSGPMTGALKNADMVLLSEVKKWKMRRGRGIRSTRTHSSRRIPHVAINWKKSEFQPLDKGFRVFHRSGKAEGWRGIRTPARGVLWIVGYWKDDPDKTPYCYWVTWFLNSWFPFNPDRWTGMRRHIVRDMSLPVVEDLMRYMEKTDKAKGTLGGGDTNSIKWRGYIAGLRPVHNRGLDRVWESGVVRAEFDGKTPKTGSGNDMQHEGIRVKQRI